MAAKGEASPVLSKMQQEVAVRGKFMAKVKAKVTYRVKPRSGTGKKFLAYIPILVIIGIFFYILSNGELDLRGAMSPFRILGENPCSQICHETGYKGWYCYPGYCLEGDVNAPNGGQGCSEGKMCCCSHVENVPSSLSKPYQVLTVASAQCSGYCKTTRGVEGLCMEDKADCCVGYPTFTRYLDSNYPQKCGSGFDCCCDVNNGYCSAACYDPDIMDSFKQGLSKFYPTNSVWIDACVQMHIDGTVEDAAVCSVRNPETPGGWVCGVREYYCDQDNTVQNKILKCPDGCVNGACED